MTYLARIDEGRVYSNGGPLSRLLAARLAERFAVADGCVEPLANGTLALTVVLETIRRPGSLCLMPSWTFAATPHAAVAAGLTPYFVDVDAEGVLTPPLVRQALDRLTEPVGAVITVSPFGLPLDPDPWDRFTEETGIPVAIDAAAAFDTLRPAKTPAIVSLHATKPVSAGEGAFVLSTQAELVQECMFRSNFGFRGTREAAFRSTNAKMSEYHAAVALASLDEWPRRREEFLAVARRYRRLLASYGPGTPTLQRGFGETWVGTVCLVNTGTIPSATAETRLNAAAIDTRHWWGWGCHCQPAFAGYQHGDLTMTHMLARQCLGLPFFVDLTEAQQARIIDRLMAEREPIHELLSC